MSHCYTWYRSEEISPSVNRSPRIYLGWLITWHMEALYNINQVKPNIWPLKVACSGNHSGGARFLPVSLSRPQYQKSEARKIGPPLLFSISGIVVSIHFASGSRPAAYFSFSDALMLLWSCWHTRSHQFPDLNSTFLLSDVLASLALIIVTDSPKLEIDQPDRSHFKLSRTAH